MRLWIRGITEQDSHSFTPSFSQHTEAVAGKLFIEVNRLATSSRLVKALKASSQQCRGCEEYSVHCRRLLHHALETDIATPFS